MAGYPQAMIYLSQGEEMNREAKKEWIAHCQTCRWSGKRCSNRDEAKQAVESHLKTHPEHKVRVLVTGG